jgi:hypothetical protein
MAHSGHIMFLVLLLFFTPSVAVEFSSCLLVLKVIFLVDSEYVNGSLL